MALLAGSNVFLGEAVMPSGLEIRAQIDAETAKALLLINGGGALALLSFFTAIVGKPGYEGLGRAVLLAVLGMMFGLVCAVLHNHYRRQCSLHHEHHGYKPPPGTLFGLRLRRPRVCWISGAFMHASWLAFMLSGGFVAGMGLLTIGW
jgi:hypothetical protein